MKKLLLFLFSHRFLALARWDIHFLQIRLANFLGFSNARIQRFVRSRQAPVYLNFGSGPRGLANDHWVNVDGFRDTNVDFVLDLSRRLPFADATFDGCFCEHVFEHFTQEEGERIAAEVARTLQRGGCFRVIVPDAESVLKDYFVESDALVDRRGGETRMEAVNSYFRQRYEHQFLYDFVTLEKTLKAAGFGDVRRAKFQNGAVSDMAVLDDERYARESLYVEAFK